MRYLATILGLFAITLSVSCLTEDLPPVHLIIEYQLRCHPDHGCSGLPDEDDHAVNGIDGHDGLDLDCQVGEEVRNISFAAACTTPDCNLGRPKTFSLSLNPQGLDNTDKNCVLKVEEGNNTLEKRCKIKEGGKAKCNGHDLDPSLPCQVAIKRDGDRVAGTLCCRSIPLEGKNPNEEDLSLQGSNTFDEPASFEIEHCR